MSGRRQGLTGEISARYGLTQSARGCYNDLSPRVMRTRFARESGYTLVQYPYGQFVWAYVPIWLLYKKRGGGSPAPREEHLTSWLQVLEHDTAMVLIDEEGDVIDPDPEDGARAQAKARARGAKELARCY